ncbi:uncharacterized protein EI90DRAFT_3030423 [Cantharellus anzutake]|uniref:uncharacterized protein n=1 Tax=Cantharellus anzutake TaxID=1750568 RepID=UPI0019056B9B|nr:uncharacterized protein EI90DRAFT_3030423 [Cantharellus anzutake]KAF8342847.1 hypothetical protein EI90DRAFT_3030423 [Cantharellus anzutake]
MFTRRSLAFLLALPSVLVSAADPAQQPVQGGCGPGVCDQLGCGGYQLENYPITTNYQQVMTGPEPWPTPDGATVVGFGEADGVTTVVFEATKPAYIAVPTNPPKDGGKWTVVEEAVTIPNGPGNTLTITSHALTTVPACPTPSTITSTTTTYITTTSTVTSRTTDTQYITLPPITTFSTTTFFATPVTVTSYVTLPPVTSISLVTLPPLTVTSTITTTATITIPVTPSPPTPTCTPAVLKPWTNVDIYTNNPFRFVTNDPSPQILSIQDAGYKKERYSVVVDGQQIGTTSPINPDSGVWCALTPAAKDTCEVKGLSKGQFIIPPGSHVVEIVNILGVVNNPDAYSTIFYQLERQCTITIPPPPPCSQRPVQDVAVVDVYKNNPYNFSFNFNFPTKLTVMDAGYRAEKYKISIDGVLVGDTDAYAINRLVWCGITPNTYQNCLNSQMSKGEFVVPAGVHTVTVTLEAGVFEPTWTYSTIFYKIDTYCPS